MPKPRLSPPLSEDEVRAAMLGDVVDQLESDQAIDPRPTLEDAANTVRYVRDRLAKRQAPPAREEGDEIPF